VTFRAATLPLSPPAGAGSSNRSYRSATVIRNLCLLVSLQLASGAAVAQSLTVNIDVFGLNENQFNANAALEEACDAIGVVGPSTAAAADLLNTCAALTPLDEEDAALAAGLNRLVPEEAFALSDSLTDAADAQVSNVFSRMQNVRGSRAVSANTLARAPSAPASIVRTLDATKSDAADGFPGGLGSGRLEFFFSGHVSDGDVDGAGVQQDAGTTSNGFTFGADYRLAENLVAGIGLGYAASDTMFDAVPGGTDVRSFNATLFGTYFREESFYADVVLDVGRSRIELVRQISLPDRPNVLALGETDSSTLSLTLGFGYAFRVRDWDLGPHARLGLTRSAVDAYDERASADTAGFGSVLSIGSQAVTSARLSAGAHAAYPISTARGVLTPQLTLDLEFETEGDKDVIDATFSVDPGGTRFAVDGTRRDRQYMNLGAGTIMVFSGGTSAFAFYETRLQHDFITQHWLKVGARREF